MRSILAALVVAFAATSASAQPATKPAAAPAPRLSVDSTFSQLAADPRTAAVLMKRLPGFLERMRDDPEITAMFGGVTVREMSYDDAHARGFTPEVLARLDAELARAQEAPPATP